MKKKHDLVLFEFELTQVEFRHLVVVPSRVTLQQLERQHVRIRAEWMHVKAVM